MRGNFKAGANFEERTHPYVLISLWLETVSECVLLLVLLLLSPLPIAVVLVLPLLLLLLLLLPLFLQLVLTDRRERYC